MVWYMDGIPAMYCTTDTSVLHDDFVGDILEKEHTLVSQYMCTCVPLTNIPSSVPCTAGRRSSARASRRPRRTPCPGS